jgi:hypothetical protein
MPGADTVAAPEPFQSGPDNSRLLQTTNSK